MADLITLKGGNGEVPELQDREPAIRKDTKALYIGIDGQNVKVGDKSWGDRIKASESQISTLNTDLANIKQLYATTNYVDELIAGINTRFGDLESLIETINSRVEALEDAVETINTRLDAMATPDE